MWSLLGARRTGKRLLMIATAAALWVGGSAKAQFGEMAGIGEAMQPEYLSRDIVIFAQSLNLDDTQRVIVEALFDDYQSAFDQSKKKMQQRFEDMREQLQVGGNDPDRVLKLVFQPIRQQIGDRAALGQQFMQNVRVVLTEDQMTLWPAFERRIFREKNLYKGKLSGESLNLLDALRDAHVDEKDTQQIAPVVLEYEVALDVALRAREAAVVSPKNAMMLALEDSDMNQQMAEHKRQIGLQLAVRNVNDEFIEKIAAELPPEAAREFKASALDRAYPRIYRETPVQRIFTAARELEGLDAAVKQSVVELEAAFLADLTVANQNLLAALRSQEPDEARQRAENFTRRTQNQPSQAAVDPMRELFVRRDAMCRSYCRQLKTLLTQEQFDQLPGGNRWIEEPAEEPPPAAAGVGSSTSAMPSRPVGERGKKAAPPQSPATSHN